MAPYTAESSQKEVYAMEARRRLKHTGFDLQLNPRYIAWNSML